MPTILLKQNPINQKGPKSWKKKKKKKKRKFKKKNEIRVPGGGSGSYTLGGDLGGCRWRKILREGRFLQLPITPKYTKPKINQGLVLLRETERVKKNQRLGTFSKLQKWKEKISQRESEETKVRSMTMRFLFLRAPSFISVKL